MNLPLGPFHSVQYELPGFAGNNSMPWGCHPFYNTHCRCCENRVQVWIYHPFSPGTNRFRNTYPVPWDSRPGIHIPILYCSGNLLLRCYHQKTDEYPAIFDNNLWPAYSRLIHGREFQYNYILRLFGCYPPALRVFPGPYGDIQGPGCDLPGYQASILWSYSNRPILPYFHLIRKYPEVYNDSPTPADDYPADYTYNRGNCNFQSARLNHLFPLGFSVLHYNIQLTDYNPANYRGSSPWHDILLQQLLNFPGLHSNLWIAGCYSLPACNHPGQYLI